jgi:hypothetical protein
MKIERFTEEKIETIMVSDENFNLVIYAPPGKMKDEDVEGIIEDYRRRKETKGFSKVEKKESDSMYLPRHSCMLIWSGVKTLIVKEKHFEGMLKKKMNLCDDNYKYGDIVLTRMFEMTREEVDRSRKRSRLTDLDMEDWKGAKIFYGYDFEFEPLEEPQEAKVPHGAQTFFNIEKTEGSTLEKQEVELVGKGFFIDEEERVRFIPETEGEKVEYSNRVSFAQEYSKTIPSEQTRKIVEKDMRKYRSEDLKKANPKFLGSKEFLDVWKSKGGQSSGLSGFCDSDGTVYILVGREGSLADTWIDRTFNHEMGHSVFMQKNNAFSSSFYGDSVTNPDIKSKIGDDISPYAFSHSSGRELIAEGFEMMRSYPAKSKALCEMNPDLKKIFTQIQKDTGYRLVSRGKTP